MSLPLPYGPRRIVCLTGETTGWPYLLGPHERIDGVAQMRRTVMAGAGRHA